MSNYVFPRTLPGVKMSLKRRAQFATTVQTAVSGREYRATQRSRPIVRYELGFEFARSSFHAASTYRELETALGMILGAQGRLDSFLLVDPEDSVAASVGCGLGTGSATAFQLQRGLGGSISDELGTWTRPVIPTFNYIGRSNIDAGVSFWNLNTGVSVVSNAAVAPDGTPSAALLAYSGAGAAGDYRIYQNGAARLRGVSYISSVWLRADAPTTLWMNDNAYTGLMAVAVTSTWQRFYMPAALGDGFGASQLALYSPAGVNTAFAVYVWGAQVENVAAGQVVPGPNIYTAGASALGARPAFWPASGDGFEPVAEPIGMPVITKQGDWEGAVPLKGVARSNLLIRSRNLANASWVKNGGATATTPSAATSPDGTSNASYAKNAAGVTSANVGIAGTTVTGVVYVFSAWLLGDGTNTTCDLFMQDNLGSVGLVPISYGIQPGGAQGAAVTIAGGTLVRVTGLSAVTWTRVYVVAKAASVLTGCYVFPNTSAGTALTGVHVDACMLEDGAVVPGSFISTTTAVVSATDFTLSSTGLVTLATALPVNAWLTWSGTFARRVRAEVDAIEWERFGVGYWDGKVIPLVQVLT